MKILGDPRGIPASIRSFQSLEQLLQWALRAGLDVDEIVQQDEYTFDVLITLRPDLVLAFDCT